MNSRVFRPTMRFATRRAVALIVLFAAVGAGLTLQAQHPGETLFKQTCAACHTIGAGRLVGPDLANVDQRRTEEWLLKFIRTPMQVINSGDPQATAVYEEYGRVPMPDNNLSDDEIRSVIDYIVLNSPGRDVTPTDVATDTGVVDGEGGDSASEATASAPEPSVGGRLLSEATETDVRHGGRLFAGYERFEKGGASCISCHNVDNDAVISGGALAKDLTDAYTRLSANGVSAVIRSTPFPAMKDAYQDAPLTDEEMYDIVAFLQHTADTTQARATVPYHSRLALAGIGGAVALLAFFSGVWFRRKKRSVNQEVFDRQINATDD